MSAQGGANAPVPCFARSERECVRAAAIFLARTKKDKKRIKSYIETTFGYDIGFSLDQIRPHYQFDVSCQGSVPEAIAAFLESTDFEDAIGDILFNSSDRV